MVVDLDAIHDRADPGLPPGLWAGLLGVFIAAAAVFLLRREAQPLSRLADQVDRVTIGNEVSELERAIADLDDMSRLLDDSLLAFSRGAQLALDELVDVAVLLEREVESRLSVGNDVTLAMSNATRDAQVIGNALALKRVISNLTDNALKYGASAKVAADTVGDRLIVYIDDRGPGIDTGDCNALFEPFVRLEGSRNRSTGGAGLGLAIARSIAERHGGSVALDDAPGGGTRATLTLPLFRP